jgi:hypothetical protein
MIGNILKHWSQGNYVLIKVIIGYEQNASHSNSTDIFHCTVDVVAR